MHTAFSQVTKRIKIGAGGVLIGCFDEATAEYCEPSQIDRLYFHAAMVHVKQGVARHLCEDVADKLQAGWLAHARSSDLALLPHDQNVIVKGLINLEMRKKLCRMVFLGAAVSGFC